MSFKDIWNIMDTDILDDNDFNKAAIDTYERIKIIYNELFEDHVMVTDADFPIIKNVVLPDKVGVLNLFENTFIIGDGKHTLEEICKTGENILNNVDDVDYDEKEMSVIFTGTVEGDIVKTISLKLESRPIAKKKIVTGKDAARLICDYIIDSYFKRRW